MKLNILIVAMTLFPNAVFADKDTDILIEGCKQLASMYENRSKLNILNSLTLSPSDSLKAGYCKGTIETFVSFASVRTYRCGWYNNEICHEQRCSEFNWYNIARKIALTNPDSDINGSGSFDIEDVVISGCR
jgi:hypothetical protein